MPSITMMLKGYQRRLIMMPTKSSPLFETAYFILRKETDTRPPCPNEMLYEASRILEETRISDRRRVLKPRHLAITFGIGFAVGAALLGILWLILG